MARPSKESQAQWLQRMAARLRELQRRAEEGNLPLWYAAEECHLMGVEIDRRLGIEPTRSTQGQGSKIQ